MNLYLRSMTVFISRDLAPDADFRRLLMERGWQVSGQSLVTLTALPFETIPPADWIFFTSQQAVRFFFQQLQKQKIARPPAKWAALGTVTAKVLAEYVESVDFVGTGAPEGTAVGFREAVFPFSDKRAPFRGTPTPDPSPKWEGRRDLPQDDDITSPLPFGGGVGGGVAGRGAAGSGLILFPAARHSTHTLRTLLSPDFQCIHFEIYDNQPVQDPPLRTDDVLVFTSPLNATAYFAKHRLQGIQRVVAIGHTTAAALTKLGISEVTTATEPSEAALAETVLQTR